MVLRRRDLSSPTIFICITNTQKILLMKLKCAVYSFFLLIDVNVMINYAIFTFCKLGTSYKLSALIKILLRNIIPLRPLRLGSCNFKFSNAFLGSFSSW